MTAEENKIFKSDIELFCRTFLNFHPYPYQVELLEKSVKTEKLAVRFGRQTGKTLTIAASAVYHLFWNDNYQIIVAAPSQEQSNRFIKYVKDFIHNSKLMSKLITRETVKMVELSNRSTVLALPGGQAGKKAGHTMRGAPANLIIIDEAAWITESVIYDVILPIGTFHNARIWAISTPCGKNHFYKMVKEQGFKELVCSVEKAMLFSENIKKYVTEKVWPVMSKSSVRYRREYMAEFDVEQSQVFPAHLLWGEKERNVIGAVNNDLRFIDTGEPGKEYVMGVDVGKWRDMAVIAIFEIDGDKNRLVHMREFEDPSQREFRILKNTIMTLLDQFNVTKLVIDALGQGDPVVEDLEYYLNMTGKGVYLVPFIFTYNSRLLVVENIIQLLEKDCIKIPPYAPLINEMMDYERIFTEDGKIKYRHPKDSTSDRLDAVMMALWGCQEAKYDPIIIGLKKERGED